MSRTIERARRFRRAIPTAALRSALLCAAASACAPATDGQPPPSPAGPAVNGTAWPTFRGDPAQTGNASHAAAGALPASPLAGELKLLWTYEAKEPISSTAAVQGGAAYVGTDAGRLLALGLAGGQLKWQYKAQGAIEAAPGIQDGKVFVGDRAGVFHAVNAETGAKVWTYETEGEIISSANFAGGDVLFGSYDGNLYCLAAERGKVAWKFKTDYVVHCSPCIADGSAVIAGCDSRLRTIDLAKGTESGSVALSSEPNVASSPAFDGERVYVSTCDRHLVCVAPSPAVSAAGNSASSPSGASGSSDGPALRSSAASSFADLSSVALAEEEATADKSAGGEEPNDSEARAPQQSQQLDATGQARREAGRSDWRTLRKVWDIQVGGEFEFHASPALSKDRVIFAGQDGLVRCLAKADGKQLWTFRTRGEVNSSPVIAGDRVLFGSGDGTLYAVKLSDGREVWRFRTGAPITSSPAVGEGRLVIAAEDGAVYCFGPALGNCAASSFANPPPPGLRRTTATADKSAGGEEPAGGER